MNTPTTKTLRLTEFKYVPFMCLWVAFKKGGTKTFYSRELQNSLKAVANRDILPKIDLHYGFQGLIFLAEETLKDQFNKAVIYGLVNDNKENGKPVREYDNKGNCKIFQEPDFNSEQWQKAKDKMTFKIMDSCKNAQIIINVFDPQNPIILKK